MKMYQHQKHVVFYSIKTCSLIHVVNLWELIFLAESTPEKCLDKTLQPAIATLRPTFDEWRHYDTCVVSCCSNDMYETPHHSCGRQTDGLI